MATPAGSNVRQPSNRFTTPLSLERRAGTAAHPACPASRHPCDRPASVFRYVDRAVDSDNRVVKASAR